MGLKRQKSSWSLLAQHLYTRQYACEPQTGSLAYFSVVVTNRKKKTSSFLDRSFTSSNMQAAMQGQTVLKVQGNLNKGASGSMKLNRIIVLYFILNRIIVLYFITKTSTNCV